MSTTTQQRPASSGFVPVAPYPVSATSVLMQNQVASNQVLVDLQAAGSPVATFTNPLAHGGVPEAFAIVDLAEGGQQVVYVAQDASQQSGWSVGPLPNGPGAGGSWPATAVVAAVTGSQDGLVDVFWNDGSSLQHTWLQPDGSFAAPRAIARSLGGLGVAYAVAATADTQPIPVVYGIDGTNVVLLTWAGAGHGWSTTTFQGSGFSTSSPLTLGVVPGAGSGGQATVYSGGRYFSAAIDFVRGTTINGVKIQSLSGAPAPVASVFAQAVAPQGGTLAYVLGTDGVPYALSVGGTSLPGAVALPCPSATATQAVAVAQPATRAKDGTLLTGLANVYLVHEAPDGSVDLSLLRQLGWSDGGTLPQWAPPIPIDAGVDSAYPILAPSDPDTVFLADRLDEGALAVYTHTVTDAWRNPGTNVPEWSAGPHWTGGDIRQQATESYEITSYVVQVTVTDANRTPLANYPLELTASAPCGVVVGTSCVPISATRSTPITTDGSGTASFSIEATDLAPPSLILTDPAQKITSPAGGPLGTVSISPGASVQTYMSTTATAQANGSTGTLPYLPPASQSFSASMMTGATTPSPGAAEGTGTPLFPGVQGSAPTMPASEAVTNVNNMMSLGYAPVGDAAAPHGPAFERPAGGPVGFVINNSDPTRPQYLEFSSGAELRAAWQAQHQQPRVHLLHDAKDAFSDAWKGIKAGATKVADVAVDMEKGVVSMAIWIGKEATEIGDFVITCVEDACNAIVAVFSALEAIVKDVIDFLKALLDFGHVFDTQWAFMQSLNQGLLTASEIVQWAIQQLNPGGGDGPTTFFSGLVDQVNETFDDAEAQLDGQNVQQAAGPNWQPMGQPPSNTATIGGATSGLDSDGGPLTPAQLSANPQATWMQSQLGASASSAAAASAFDIDDLRALFDGESTTALADAVAKFEQAFDVAMGQFKGGAEAFEQAFQDLLDAVVAAIDKDGKHDPSNLQNVPMHDLLEAERELVLGMLDFLDGVALTFLGMVDAGVTWLLDVANTPIKDKHTPIGDAVQLLYDGLWVLATDVMRWKPPSSGWAPPAGTTIPGWDPQKGMQKDLTYAGIAGLVTGFPVCILFEILTGKEPFPGGALPGSEAGPEVGQTQYEPILATINLVNATLSFLRDALIVDSYMDAVVPKGKRLAIGGLAGLAFLSGASSFVFQWRGAKSWDASIENRLVALLSLLGVSSWLSMLILTWFSKSLTWRTRMATVSTLFGALTIAYSNYLAFTAKKRLHLPEKDHAMWAWSVAMGNLAPVPDLLSLLVIPEVQDATEDLPIAGCLKLVVDLSWGVIVIPTLEIGEAVEVGRHTSSA